MIHIIFKLLKILGGLYETNISRRNHITNIYNFDC